MKKKATTKSKVKSVEPKLQRVEAGALVPVDPNHNLPVLETPPDQLIALAIQSGNVSIDVLERLSKLQQEWLDRQAKQIFYQALTDFQSKVPVIPKLKNVTYKTRTNDVVDYNHAELDKMVTVIQPFKKECNLSHEWKYEHFHDPKGTPMIRCICVVTHPAGHSESTAMEGEHDNSGNKNGIQGRGSTVTYLQRYTLKGAFGLVEAGVDNDGGKMQGEAREEKLKPTAARPAMTVDQMNRAIIRLNKDEDILQECKNQFTLSAAQLATLNEQDEKRKARALQRQMDQQAR